MVMRIFRANPGAYNKDLQEDKALVFDTADTIMTLLHLWQKFLPALCWNQEVMYERAFSGFTTASTLADELARLGMPFREAHHAVSRLVDYCLRHKKRGFNELTAGELRGIHPALCPELVQKVARGI